MWTINHTCHTMGIQHLSKLDLYEGFMYLLFVYNSQLILNNNILGQNLPFKSTGARTHRSLNSSSGHTGRCFVIDQILIKNSLM